MNRERLEEAELLAIDIAAPLPAIMNLVAENSDDNLSALKILLQNVDNNVHDLCEVLYRLQQDAKPPALEPAA